jgi:hypothetical protein
VFRRRSPCRSDESMVLVSRRLIDSPLSGRQGLHRQRMNLLAHPVAQSFVDLLVAFDAAGTLELGGHDGGEEMAPVTVYRDVLADHAVRDVALDF